MIRPAHYRYSVPATDWRRQPREKGGGRHCNISGETRHRLFLLMRVQRAAQKRIDQLLDKVDMAQTQRARTEALRKIWRGRGK